MFDFRYHALSLVAVFLALGLGIVLGVTIGDSLLSRAERNVRVSLRDDVLEARSRARETEEQLERRDRLIQIASPALAGDALRGQRVGVVALGSPPEELESSVRRAVESAGGRIDSVSSFETPVDPARLADALGRRRKALAANDERLRRLARRIARSVLVGGRAIERLKRTLPERFRGDYGRLDAVALYRRPDSEEPEPGTFEEAMIERIRDEGVPVVGVEASRTEPSQVPFYTDRRLSSVDSVDLAGGQVALALALAGARGSFGFKETAERPLPDVSSAPRAR